MLHLGWNLHPIGGLIISGTNPSMYESPLLRLLESGTHPKRPFVYGWAAFLNRVKVDASSTTVPAYMIQTLSQISAITPRSCVINSTEMPKSRFNFVKSSKICLCIVTSRAEVGSSAISSLGLDDKAMAIAAL